MGRITEPVRFLDDGEMKKIHLTSMRILEEIGMWIDSTEALEYLRDFHCKVDFDRRIVKFPAEIVEDAVARMRKAYSNPERLPKRMAQRYSQIYFSTMPHRVHPDFSTNTGGFCVYIYDLDGKRRYANMDDVRKCIRLADKLDNVDMMGLPVSAQEIPSAMRPVVMAAELVKNTRKLGGIETFDKIDVEYISRIAEVVAGGADQLRREPVLVGYGEARTPLCIDGNMAEVLIEYVKRGLPQSQDTMPNAGATAPMSAAGTLALGIAETLGGLVLGFSVDENAVMSIDVCPSYADMHSGLYTYASPERMKLLAANIQMISEFYGCPSGTHGGKTDACYPGVQAGMEKLMSMLFPVLAGAVGIGTMGHLENALTFSPQQLVIDNEIAGAVRHVLRGFEVNDETLMFDVIKEVGIGGSFLAHPSTAERFRDESYLSRLFERVGWDTAWSQPEEKRGTEARAHSVAERLMEAEGEPVISPEQEQAIDEIVKEAEARRRERGEIK